jgi:hypothetical protein
MNPVGCVASQKGVSDDKAVSQGEEHAKGEEPPYCLEAVDEQLKAIEPVQQLEIDGSILVWQTELGKVPSPFNDGSDELLNETRAPELATPDDETNAEAIQRQSEAVVGHEHDIVVATVLCEVDYCVNGVSGGSLQDKNPPLQLRLECQRTELALPVEDSVVEPNSMAEEPPLLCVQTRGSSHQQQIENLRQALLTQAYLAENWTTRWTGIRNCHRDSNCPGPPNLQKVIFEWEQRHQADPSDLKLFFVQPSVLTLRAQASQTGIGVVLHQVQNGQEKVNATVSQTLPQTERQYCVTIKELLVVINMLCLFYVYLAGGRTILRSWGSAASGITSSGCPIAWNTCDKTPSVHFIAAVLSGRPRAEQACPYRDRADGTEVTAAGQSDELANRRVTIEYCVYLLSAHLSIVGVHLLLRSVKCAQSSIREQMNAHFLEEKALWFFSTELGESGGSICRWEGSLQESASASTNVGLNEATSTVNSSSTRPSGNCEPSTTLPCESSTLESVRWRTPRERRPPPRLGDYCLRVGDK